MGEESYLPNPMPTASMKLPKCESTSIPNVPLFEKTKEDHWQMSPRESPLRHSESAATYEHRVTFLHAYTT